MKKAIKNLFQKKISELTVDELVTAIQYAVFGNTNEQKQDISKEIACVDENFYRMMQEHPERYIIGMKALSHLLGCSIRKAHDLRKTGIFDLATFTCGQKLVFNKEMIMDAYSEHGIYLKGKVLQNKIKEYKATVS